MRVKILQSNPKSFEILAQALQKGEVVGMPTETVYGLAGDCFNTKALAKIFETKERPTFDPLIIHAGHMGESPSLLELEKQEIIDGSQISPESRTGMDQLIQAFWPGPLTLILPKHSRIPDLATSGLPTVAVRMPAHPLAQKLIQECGRPLAAPSANRFGRISPTTAQSVAEELGDRIDWILDGGTCDIGLESTILSVHPQKSHEVRIFRAGGTSKERIEAILGFAVASIPEHKTGVNPLTPSEAPGQLESHYAPRKPLILLDRLLQNYTDEELARFLKQLQLKLESLHRTPEPLGLGILLHSGISEILLKRLSRLTSLSCRVATLSPTGDLSEAAHNLFSEMRWLDSSDALVLLAEPCPKAEGLGYAIEDRLRRASSGSRNFLPKTPG